MPILSPWWLVPICSWLWYKQAKEQRTKTCLPPSYLVAGMVHAPALCKVVLAPAVHFSKLSFQPLKLQLLSPDFPRIRFSTWTRSILLITIRQPVNKSCVLSLQVFLLCCRVPGNFLKAPAVLHWFHFDILNFLLLYNHTVFVQVILLCRAESVLYLPSISQYKERSL